MLIIAFMVLMSSSVYATTGKITSDNVRIRKEANTSSEIFTVISEGSEVEVLETEGEWTKVKYSEFTGYIRNDMLEVQQSTENNEETTNTEENKEEVQKSSEDNKEETKTEENAQNTNIETTKEEKIKKDSSYTISSKIDLKIIPSINSSIIANVSENSNIQVKDIINKWCYIENGTSCGWVLKSKIEANLKDESVKEENGEETTSEEEKTEENTNNEVKEEKTEEIKQDVKEVNLTKYVSVSSLNLRKDASTSAEVIDQLNLNTQVTVTAIVDNKWAKVSYNNKTGYVSNKYLSDSKTAVTSRSENTNREATNNASESKSKEAEKAVEEEPASSSESSSGSGSAVVAYAKQFLGCRYVYGGMSPSGFDCSGFTSYVYKHFGYSLNRTSSGQRSNGVAVSKSNLQAGDILCFNGHVGLYIGGGSFIHAANPSKGVIISSLSESYYQKNYITARRIL